LQTDSLVGLTIEGSIFSLDRKTGVVNSPMFSLPCSPAKPNPEGKPPQWAINLGNSQTDKAFGKLKNGKSIFEVIMNIIFGGGACVSNYFAIDPNNGRIYIAATAADEHDGTIDGFSEDGAL